MSPSNFGSLQSESQLQALNLYLADRSYVSGFKPSADDSEVLARLSANFGQSQIESFPHVKRWSSHMKAVSKDGAKSNQGNYEALVKRLFGSTESQSSKASFECS